MLISRWPENCNVLQDGLKGVLQQDFRQEKNNSALAQTRSSSVIAVAVGLDSSLLSEIKLFRSR